MGLLERSTWMLGALALGCCAADALTPSGASVRLGPPGDFTIVTSVVPTRQESYAAHVLADRLQALFGVALPVLSEGETPGPCISIGATDLAREAGVAAPLAPQSYSLQVAGGNLLIRGGTPGPLNGVIALLEEDLGCRWYTDEVVTRSGREAPCVRVPDLSGQALQVTPREFAPPFQMRELLYLYGTRQDGDWPLFNRLAPISYHTFLPAESGAQIASGFFIHTYHALLPVEEHYDQHPEYYALQDGQRTRLSPVLGSVCYTHADVPRIMEAKLRAAIAASPDLRLFSVSAPDTPAAQCECPECQALIAGEGLVGAQIQLANRVVEPLARDYPDVRVTFLAYSLERPGTIKPHPNLVCFFAPINSRHNPVDMLVPLPANQAIAHQLEGWVRDGRVYFWDYIDLTRAPTPYPNLDPFAASVRFLAERGASGYFADCTSANSSLAPLKKWVFAKLLWDPRRDLDALIGEFLGAVYGSAAAEMAGYIEVQRTAWRRFFAAWQRQGGGVRFSFTDDEVTRLREFLTAAAAKADDRTIRARLAREELVLYTMQLAGNPKVMGGEAYAATRQAAMALLDCLPDDASLFRDRVVERWERKLDWLHAPAAPGQYSPNAVTVFEPLTVAGMSEYLDDPASRTGKAARHLGGKPWGIQYYYEAFLDYLLPGQSYVVRLRVRPELRQPRAGRLLVLSLHHHGDRALNDSQPRFEVGLSADDPGGYRWVALGILDVVDPGAVGMLWLDSTVAPEEAVWYDCLELVPLDEYRETETLPTVRARL